MHELNFQVTVDLNWIVRFIGALETQIVSVERIKRYSEVESEVGYFRHYVVLSTSVHCIMSYIQLLRLQFRFIFANNISCFSSSHVCHTLIKYPQAARIVPDNRPAPEWPEKGVVEFKEYCTRYREGLDLVLKGISCHIKSGEKVKFFSFLIIHNRSKNIILAAVWLLVL